ncbi:MAG: MOSC domain-containing protein [Thermomicrobiales bacterium]
MWQGSVVAVFVASGAGEPMNEVGEADAIAGLGLAGDRYAKGQGFYSWFAGPLREVSLIEEEVLEALKRDHQLNLPPGAHRRNIVTRGVPLGHLIGHEFRVGDAIFRGVEISEPCGHLVDVTGITGILSPLIHRGGLHAAVVSGGYMRVGDTVAPEESS